MTDPYAAQLAADILDTAQEWCRRTGLGDSTERRVAWMTDGTVEIQDGYGAHLHGPYRVTVLVEPAETWQQVTWAEVADALVPARVRLGEAEAVVISAVHQRWHVDPRSSKYDPRPLEHDVVFVQLEDRGAYYMPPIGPVMLLTGGPVGPAVAALATEFEGMEVIQDGQ